MNHYELLNFHSARSYYKLLCRVGRERGARSASGEPMRSLRSESWASVRETARHLVQWEQALAEALRE